MELSRQVIDKVLIVGITPYFLEKGSLWFAPTPTLYCF